MLFKNIGFKRLVRITEIAGTFLISQSYSVLYFSSTANVLTDEFITYFANVV